MSGTKRTDVSAVRAGWRRRLAGLFVSAGLVVLVVAPTAQADRGPTAAERTGIEQAAYREYGEPGVHVMVSDIAVSTTARSWATASVDVDYGASTQDYQAEFRRRGNGSWTGAGNKMPAAVEDDLGISDTQGTAEKVGSIIGYAVVGLVAAALLALTVWGLSSSGGGGPLSTTPNAPPSAPGGSTAATYSPPKQKRPCPGCGGRGRGICSNCGGRGQLEVRDPEAGFAIKLVPCPACGTQGGPICNACGGRGWTEA
jgi:hypothetical protein